MQFTMDLTTFLILGFACFRITHLIVADVITAPFRAIFIEEIEEPDATGRMNRLTIPKPPAWRIFFGSLIACPWCMGVWVAILLVLGWYYIPNIVFPIALVFAISGLGIVFEVATRLWTVNSFSPTKEQLQRFEELKKQFYGEKAD